MFLNYFTCPHEVIQHNKHLLNSQNREMELFSSTWFGGFKWNKGSSNMVSNVSKKVAMLVGARRYLESGNKKYMLDTIHNYPSHVLLICGIMSIFVVMHKHKLCEPLVCHNPFFHFEHI